MSQGSRNERQKVIAAYCARIDGASNEAARKEIFLHLLGRLFREDELGIIDQFASGAEKGIDNIARSGKGSEFGRADTQYGSVIIEFERSLARTGAHAEEQLKEYVSGNWNSGIQTRFTLLATDCLEWRVYTLDYNSLRGLGKLQAEDLKLELARTLTVEPKKPDEFYFFLDRYLFHTEPLPATLEGIRAAFGYGTDVFQAAMIKMGARFEDIRKNPSMLTAVRQWASFLKIAYGKFENDEKIFLIHSYLSVLAKMLAYTVLTGDDFIDDSEMADILNGDVFRRKNILNFTDDDFFRWTANEANDINMKEAWRVMAQALSRFDFSNISEDILKGVYQELVDDDTRHSLGEHYTPDWLCARMVEELKPEAGRKILDPSCGSGSFLKACANYLQKNNPAITTEELNSSLYGIDVHPLSVQIAKATLLMAYGKKLSSVKQPLRLNIFLANTLLIQREEAQLLGNIFRLAIDQKQVEIPATVFRNQKLFSEIVYNAEIMAQTDYMGERERNAANVDKYFVMHFEHENSGCPITHIQTAGGRLYRAFLAAKKAGNDSIWAYMVANTYAPVYLRNYFDLVVGNPPWVLFRFVTSREYQDEIQAIARDTGVAPKSGNLLTALDLASVFLGHCLEHFLKEGGKLAFVLPRSIFVSDQHQNIRQGKVNYMALQSLWDLGDVAPLFNVPVCALFCKRGKQTEKAPGTIPCRVFSGHLASRNGGDNKLSIKKDRAYLSFLNDRNAWSVGEPIKLHGSTIYLEKFRPGAKIFPRSLCFVDIDQDFDGDFSERKLRVKTAAAIKREAKFPWKNIDERGSVHSRFIFRTVLANNLAPFALNGSYLVALPLKITEEGPRIMEIEEIELAGGLESGLWFSACEDQWKKFRTEKNQEFNLAQNYNWQGNLEIQGTNRRFLVLYNTSGTNVCGIFIDRDAWEQTFLTDIVTFSYATDIREEALYLTAYLNSAIPNRIIKPFQARGLLGERHISKKILEIPLPLYDAANADHRRLAELADTASRKSAAFLAGKKLGPQGGNLNAGALGRLRGEVRKYLARELAEIDGIWEKLLLGR